MLGHASSTLTRDTYTSVADEAKHAAADAISVFLNAADTTRKQPRSLRDLAAAAIIHVEVATPDNVRTLRGA